MIVHLCGPMCSGKTYLFKKFQEWYGYKIPMFDLKDFYRKHNCFVDDVLDLQRMAEVIHDFLDTELKDFLSLNPMTFVETTGANRCVNNILLRSGYPVLDIRLRRSDSVMEEGRSEERKIPVETIQHVNQFVAGFLYDKVSGNLSADDAFEILKRLFPIQL